MSVGADLIDSRLPWIHRLGTLEQARSLRSAGPRLRAIRQGGERLGAMLREQGPVVCVRTLNLSTLLYPTAFAFSGSVPLPWPYVVMTHRCLLVQVQTDAGIKNILWNPTDFEASEATPFFADLLRKMPNKDLGRKLLATQWDQADVQLRALGIAPEDIDVIAFDHFHTQDLRPLLGSALPDANGRSIAARFPNALLLAPAMEWEDWDDLHPLQQPWFIREGKRGIDPEKVVLFDGDLHLGEGCMILRTPGHTTGNQTLFVHGERGVFGCSENGCSADSWTPQQSRIPGLKHHATSSLREVVLNSNTPELAAEQYTSMILEKTVVDRSETQPGFVQMFPSSEVTPSVLAPGVVPSMRFEERNSGQLYRR